MTFFSHLPRFQILPSSSQGGQISKLIPNFVRDYSIHSFTAVFSSAEGGKLLPKRMGAMAG